MNTKKINLSEWGFLSYEKPKNLVRYGSLDDGGYVTSQKVLLASEFLISGGISFNPEFEIDFYHLNPSAVIILIDGSISPLQFLLGPFFRKLTGKSFTRAFNRTAQHFYIKRRANLLKEFINKRKNITYFLEKYIPKGTKGFLKLDIEGSEWELLNDILASQHLFIGMSIEFHEVPAHINELKAFVEKLEHEIVFIEVNSVGGFENGLPNLLEISFLHPIYIERENDESDSYLRRPSSNDRVSFIPIF